MGEVSRAEVFLPALDFVEIAAVCRLALDANPCFPIGTSCGVTVQIRGLHFVAHRQNEVTVQIYRPRCHVLWHEFKADPACVGKQVGEPAQVQEENSFRLQFFDLLEQFPGP